MKHKTRPLVKLVIFLILVTITIILGNADIEQWEALILSYVKSFSIEIFLNKFSILCPFNRIRVIDFFLIYAHLFLYRAS